MKTRFVLACFLAAVLLGACTSTGAVMLGGTGTYPELPASEVRVFLHEDDAPAGYERIALVTARTDVEWTDETHLVRALRKRAAKLGANGIILESVKGPTTLEQVAEVLTDYRAQRRASAVAIRLPRTGRSHDGDGR